MATHIGGVGSDSWIKLFEYNSGGEAEKVIDISSECCQGIIKLDEYNGYILATAEESGGQIIKASCDERFNWSFEQMATFEDYPITCIYKNDELYVLTSRGVIVWRNGAFETIVRSDVLFAAFPNSLVFMDDMLYCGTRGGIYAYNMTDKTEEWYPMDYSKYEYMLEKYR